MCVWMVNCLFDNFRECFYMLVNSDKVNWYGFFYVVIGLEEGD